MNSKSVCAYIFLNELLMFLKLNIYKTYIFDNTILKQIKVANYIELIFFKNYNLLVISNLFVLKFRIHFLFVKLTNWKNTYDISFHSHNNCFINLCQISIW